MTKTYAARTDVLGEVLLDVREALTAEGCGEKAVMQLTMAAEELFLNVASYGYPEGAGTVTVELRIREGRVTMTLRDSGPAFDPFCDAPPPDLSPDLRERRIGGLGVYLVRKTMDSVRYDRIDGENVVTLVRSAK